jgi:hypothetical protein
VTRGKRRSVKVRAWRDVPAVFLPGPVRRTARTKSPVPKKVKDKKDVIHCTCIGRWTDPDCPIAEHSEERFI